MLSANLVLAAALVYVANQGHPQYAGGLGFEEMLDIVLASAGEMGPNADYVTATLKRLEDMGIRDRALERLVEALRARERLG